MGAKQSREPRSVSMENPTPAGVLDISDDVVKRLKQGISQQARENAAVAEAAKPAPKPQPQSQPQPTKKAPVKESSPAHPTVVYQAATPIYVQGGGHTISAADVQRQMNQELQKNDEIWRQRQTQLEENLKKTNTIMESEYAKAVEGVHKRFVSTAAAHKTPPCGDLKSQLLACYRAHPGETLQCIQEVTQFKQCVDVHRIKKLDSEAEATKAPAASSSKAAVPVAKAG
ncbi:MICOS complex subunit MIC19 [Drosophila grimshawi]|uniref:GH14349 n=1 Tax=Drosophila grimshawi TaxID=7222 RepID=B4JYR1_DROGR|nr:MICOS complex subunit MIC19 [Drosophila grimshawi]EDV90823.1 GH14349 [Drosophila grimshawi]